MTLSMAHASTIGKEAPERRVRKSDGNEVPEFRHRAGARSAHVASPDRSVSFRLVAREHRLTSEFLYHNDFLN
jgi:hypothetical protein